MPYLMLFFTLFFASLYLVCIASFYYNFSFDLTFCLTFPFYFTLSKFLTYLLLLTLPFTYTLPCTSLLSMMHLVSVLLLDVLVALLTLEAESYGPSALLGIPAVENTVEISNPVPGQTMGPPPARLPSIVPRPPAVPCVPPNLSITQMSPSFLTPSESVKRYFRYVHCSCAMHTYINNT